MTTKPSPIQAPKGTQDILPADSWKWQAVEGIARQVAELYGFREIRTPVLEFAELFHRGVGETSDIVSKETYNLTDRGGRALSLRPEGTAGVVRAMIEHNVLADQGARAKVFYIAPNFRDERPQAGRYTQHHQFGAEAFGVAEPEQDVECILLQMDFYRRCGLKDLVLYVNSLGDRESKHRYRDALVAYLQPHERELSEESQRRLQTNPLRILDSKDPRDVKFKTNAPPVMEYLSDQSKAHFTRVVELLRSGGQAYQVDSSLVRGFDYYTDTLWEVVAGGLGAQNAVGGGGRYDNLVDQLGGRPTPAVGFGSGLERLLIALQKQGVALPRPTKPLVWVVVQGEAARGQIWPLLAELRAADLAVDVDFSGRSVKSQFKLAERSEAAWCVTIGDEEVRNQTVQLKNLAERGQEKVGRAEVVGVLVGRVMWRNRGA